MNKKVLSLVLALVMVLSTFSSVFAAEDKKVEDKKDTPKAGEKVEKIVGKDNKIQYIVDKKFVEGYEDGSMGYDKHIKRSEITKLIVYANGQKDLAEKLQGARQLYSDVDQKHWANGVVSVGSTVPSEANGLPMIIGYPDNSFKPEKDVTYAELAKMLVVLVKKDLTKEMYDNAKWATSWMTWAAQLGILDDVNIANSDEPATRADAFTMLYNALYKMVEFKRVPANDTIGVLSALSAEKLVLNQDKDMEYKVTKDTVFVNGFRWENTNVIKVSLLRDYDFYYGSLVRILFNDKNEVTHILELGNPGEMAVGRNANDPGSNLVWEGVADNTIETTRYNINTLLDKDGVAYDGYNNAIKSYAKIDLNAKSTKGKSITFYNEDLNTASKVVDSLRITDDTKVYVANPYNNIMKEVDGIKEAMALIGFKDYKDYKIPNVYAGFDVDGREVTYKPVQVGHERNTARVIVFNVVTDSKDGEKFRVVNSSSSLGRTTLEDTDGKLYDRDNFKNTHRFPLNYGDLYDVISFYGAGFYNDGQYKKLIDHSDTVKYPIVEVIEIYGDDHIVVADRFGDKTVLDLRDADIFNAKQYRDLRVGDKVQFAVDNNKTNVVDVLSILPKDTALEGVLKDVVPAAQMEQHVGKIINITTSSKKEGTEFYLVTIDVERDIFNGDLKAGTHQFVIDKETYRAIKQNNLIGNVLTFKVAAKDFGYAGFYKAYDFRYNDAENESIVPTKKPLTNMEKAKKAAEMGMLTDEQIQDVQNDIDASESISESNKLQKELDEIKAENAKNAVAKYEKDAANKDLKETVKDASKTNAQNAVDRLPEGKDKDDLNSRIQEAAKVQDDQKLLNEAKDAVISSNDKISTEDGLTAEKVEASIKKLIKETILTDEKYNKVEVVVVKLLNPPKENERYAPAALVESIVTLEKDGQSVTFEKNVDISENSN